MMQTAKDIVDYYLENADQEGLDLDTKSASLQAILEDSNTVGYGVSVQVTQVTRKKIRPASASLKHLRRRKRNESN